MHALYTVGLRAYCRSAGSRSHATILQSPCRSGGGQGAHAESRWSIGVSAKKGRCTTNARCRPRLLCPPPRRASHSLCSCVLCTVTPIAQLRSAADINLFRVSFSVPSSHGALRPSRRCLSSCVGLSLVQGDPGRGSFPRNRQRHRFKLERPPRHRLAHARYWISASPSQGY